MPENDTLTQRAPHSPEAERAVLGACLLDKRAANQVREQVQPTDFYLSGHQLIFDAIIKLVDDGQPCDPVTVGEALRLNGDLERCGGLNYLAGLLDAVPAPSAAPYYAGIVADRAQTRELLSAVSEVLSTAGEGGMNAAELTDMAERLVFQVATGRHSGDLHPISELVSAVYAQMSEIKAANGITGIPTFLDLDTKYLSGLQKGDLVILAARPGCGKTSMALNIAAEAAAAHNKIVAVFSLEMPKEQLVQRILCSKAKVDHSRVRKGMASQKDFGRLRKAVATMAKAQLYIDDTMSVTVSEMRSKCRKLKMDAGLDMVVVDYIQLMHGSANQRRSDNRQQEVAEISRGLKSMAKELDVPVLALSQLSRQAEQSKEAPSLAHLRESGALEQDADVVILLNRARGESGAEDEEQWKNDNSGDQVEIIVAKHRNGPTGSVEMTFVKQYTLFVNMTQDWVGGEEAPPPPPEDYGDVF